MPDKSVGLSIFGASLFVYGGVMLGRLVAILRETSIATLYGLSSTADIVVFALFLSDLVVLTLATSSLGKVVIAELKHAPENQRSQIFVSTLVSSFLFFSVVALLLGLFSRDIVEIGLSSIPLASRDAVANVLAISVWSFPFSAATVVIAAYLESERKFQLSSWRPALFNMAVLAAVIASSNNLELFSYLLPLSAFAVFAIFVVMVRVSVFRFNGGLVRLNKQIAKPYLSGIAIAVLNAVPFFFPYFVAGRLEPGDVTAYNFAYKLILFPIGLAALMFDVVVYPDMARRSAEGGVGFGKRLGNLLVMVVVGTILLTIGLYFTAEPLVALVFGYGDMGSAQIDRVAKFLSVGILGMPFYVIGSAALSNFLSRRQHKKALTMSIVTALVMIAACLNFSSSTGALGLMYAFLIMSIVRALIGLGLIK